MARRVVVVKRKEDPPPLTTSAKNIRNVTINHLRNILTDLEGVELVFLNDKWKIVYGDNLYCDYLKALNIAKMLQQVHSPQEQEEEVKQLIRPAATRHLTAYFCTLRMVWQYQN